MKTLIKYEFFKIVKKKSTWIVMAASLLVTAFFFGILPVIQFQTYDQNGVIKGLDGIGYEKQQYAEISGLLTDGYIAETIREYQQLFSNPENTGSDGNERYLIGDAYWNFRHIEVNC